MTILKLNGFLKQRKDRREGDGTVEERKRINGEGQERVVEVNTLNICSVHV